MAENEIRLSQLVGYYGPGSMLDLPDRSVLVLGLDHWDQRRDAFRLIEEPACHGSCGFVWKATVGSRRAATLSCGPHRLTYATREGHRRRLGRRFSPAGSSATLLLGILRIAGDWCASSS